MWHSCSGGGSGSAAARPRRDDQTGTLGKTGVPMAASDPIG
jgi:hypothetical protein